MARCDAASQTEAVSGMTVAIFVPTYGRSNRIPEVVEDIEAATPQDHNTYFIIESDDQDSIDVARAQGVQYFLNSHNHNYAGAINTAYEQTDEPYFFVGADDLHFHEGWLAKAMAKFSPDVMVVGTADLLNPYVAQGTHATHYLVDRRYIDEFGGTTDEEPGVVLFEGFDHQWTDTLFIDVAKERGVFVPCLESVVEHLHFLAGKSEKDATYEKGYANVDADEIIYREKMDQWVSRLA